VPGTHASQSKWKYGIILKTEETMVAKIKLSPNSKLNRNDSRDTILYEIIQIYENTIPTIIKTKYDGNKFSIKINIKFNTESILVCLYLLGILSYMIGLVFLFFQKNSCYYLCFLLGTIFIIPFIIYDIRFPEKMLFKKTGLNLKNAGYYDLFIKDVENISSEKLKFIIKYIDYLASNKPFVDTISVFSFSIAFFINIVTAIAGDKNKDFFLENIKSYFLYSMLGILIIKLFTRIIFLKNYNLLKIRRIVENVLLFRKAEKIK
jgi:hypothetical protein